VLAEGCTRRLPDGIPNLPFPKARRHALRLRLKRTHRKIAKVEEEIAVSQEPTGEVAGGGGGG
jgi:hypothetical protein